MLRLVVGLLDLSLINLNDIISSPGCKTRAFFIL